MKAHLFNLCPESELYIPKHGKSAFVRACIIDMGRRMNKSKGLPVPASVEPVFVPPVAPASVEPVAASVEPVAASVEPVAASVEPVAWVRTWRKPPCEMPADVDYSKLIHKLEGGRSICLNPPPWPAFPGLTRNHYLDWGDYVGKWAFPDPFPGPLEWQAMGEPAEPLPEHRRIVELPVVESPVVELPVVGVPVADLPVVGVPVEPLPVEPLPVEPLPVEPLPVAGVASLNILEDV